MNKKGIQDISKAWILFFNHSSCCFFFFFAGGDVFFGWVFVLILKKNVEVLCFGIVFSDTVEYRCALPEWKESNSVYKTYRAWQQPLGCLQHETTQTICQGEKTARCSTASFLLSRLRADCETTQGMSLEWSLTWKCAVLNCAYLKHTCGQRRNLSLSFFYVDVKTGHQSSFLVVLSLTS